MQTGIRILHIVCDLRRGGTEGQCARTAMGLQRLGLPSPVAVFFREGFFFLKPIEEVCGPVYEIPIRKAASIRTALAVRALARHIRRDRITLVHTWDAEAAVWGSMAARLAGVPLVTSRRDLGQIYPRWKQFLMDRADRQALKVVANCRAVADHFIGRGLPAEKIEVIGNILDLEEFDRLAEPPSPAASASAPGRGLPPMNLVCVSRLDSEKDHATLLRAFALLLRACTEHREPAPGTPFLHLVGSGGQDAALRDLARNLGVQAQVVFHGDRSDVPALLKTMRIGVLTPKANEGLSNTLLEYMAAGLPVVVTDCGGNRELIEGAACGRVVPAGDPQTCSDALLELVQQPESRETLGRSGRAYVEARHQPAAILERFEALYRELASGR